MQQYAGQQAMQNVRSQAVGYSNPYAAVSQMPVAPPRPVVQQQMYQQPAQVMPAPAQPMNYYGQQAQVNQYQQVYQQNSGYGGYAR